MARCRVYVGYDSREDIAWQVCRHSLTRLSSSNISVHPLRQPVLRELGLYTREADVTASTEFSLTRFLTPYLAASQDWSVFVDCDVVFTRPLDELLESLNPDKALYVVKHEYQPAHAIKMDGKVQATYPRKNWSSMMVFNGAHPAVKALVPSMINSASPAHLHRFGWLSDDDIGEIDLRWNFLADEYAEPSDLPAMIHYTNGGPWFEKWSDVPFADVWQKECDRYRASNGI